MAGPSLTCPPPPVLQGPHPPGLGTPLVLALDSPVWTLRFILQRIHTKILAGVGGNPHQDP